MNVSTLIASDDVLVRRVDAHRVRRLAREFGWVGLGQTLSLVATIGLTKLLTSRLGPEHYGQLALALTAATLVNQAVLGPLTTAANRFFVVYAERGALTALLSAINGIFRSASALVVLLGLIAGALAVAAGVDADLLILLGLGLGLGVIGNYYSLFNTMEVAGRRRESAAFHQAADPALRLAAAGVLVAWLGPSPSVAMLGLAAGTALALLSQRRVFLRRLGMASAPPAELLDRAAMDLWGYAKFYIAHGGLVWLVVASDRWMLKTFTTDADVGIYAAAFQIASLPSIVLAGAFAQFMTPIVFQRAGDATDAARNRLALSAIRIGVLGVSSFVGVSALVALVIGEQILVAFTSEAFRESAPYLPILILALGAMQVGQMLSLVPATTFGRMRAYVVLRIVHGLGALVLNAIAARYFGLAGVCVSQLAIGVTLVVLLAWNNARPPRSLDQQSA